MNRRLATIGAILKKDALSLAPLTAGGIILPLLQAWYYELEDWNLVVPAYVFAGFISVLLAITVVQADAAASTREDWLTRPIRRLDMVISKALFLVLAVGLPWLIGLFLTMTLHAKLPVAEAFGAAAGFAFLLIILLPVLAFACLTSNLVQALAGLIGVVLFFAALIVGFQKLSDLSMPRAFISGDDLGWPAGPVGLVVGVAGCLLILWLQYGRRRPLAARAAVFGSMLTVTLAAGSVATLGAPGVSGAAPTGLALADSTACIVQTLTPAKRDTPPVDEAADMRRWREVERTMAGADPKALAIRTRVAGLPAGWNVALDRLDVSPIQGSAPYGGSSWSNKGRQGGLDSNWLMNADQAAALTRADARIHMDARLSLLKPVRTWTFPADGKRHHLAGYGWCGSDAARPGLIRCMQMWPFAAMTSLRPSNQPETCTVDCGNVVRTPVWLQIPVPRKQSRGFSTGRGATMTVTAYEPAATVKRSLDFAGPVGVCQGPVIPAAPSNNERLAAFAPQDFDKDGRLNRQEYGKLVEDLGTGGDVDDLFQRRDRNLDGFVSPDEFRPPIA